MNWKRLILFWLVVILTGILMLAWFQHRMIYHPRSYGSIYQSYFNGSLQRISYQTPEGSQTAFYQPPSEGNPPQAIWILFGGNAALALDWMWLVEQSAGPDLGFLLIDYPGFGECEGSASPESILASSQAAWEHWQELYANQQTPKIGILGHSLGAAAALQLAETISVERVVLLSPFTSVADMVKKMFGSWLIPLLQHRFENRGPLIQLLKRDPAPSITIIHGTRDEVIPVEMGRQLAALNSEHIHYHELIHSYHNTILQDALPKILQEIKSIRELSD